MTALLMLIVTYLYLYVGHHRSSSEEKSSEITIRPAPHRSHDLVASAPIPVDRAVRDAATPHDNTDDLLDGVIPIDMGIPAERDPAGLYARVRSEKPAEPWSRATEAALRSALADLPYLTAPVRVACGATLCEIAGAIRADTSIANTNHTMKWVQSSDFMAASGLDTLDPNQTSAVFGSAKSHPSDSTFVRYVFRKPPEQIGRN